MLCRKVNKKVENHRSRTLKDLGGCYVRRYVNPAGCSFSFHESHSTVPVLTVLYGHVGFTSATSATTLLFYAIIYFHNSGSLNCMLLLFFFSTLAWLQTYKIVQILLCCCFDNILEHQIAFCPVFAQCCLFTVTCRKKKTMI